MQKTDESWSSNIQYRISRDTLLRGTAVFINPLMGCVFIGCLVITAGCHALISVCGQDMDLFRRVLLGAS